MWGATMSAAYLLAHGMLFSEPMVAALLARRKRQTRRAVTAHNSTLDGYRLGHKGALRQLWDSLDWSRARIIGGAYFEVPSLLDPQDETWHRVRPIYTAGDEIYVKETWAPHASNPAWTHYRATPPLQPPIAKWRASIIMPRRRSRLTLELLEVRSQWLQEISEEDAVAEGLIQSPRSGLWLPGNCACARWAYEVLWDSINAGRGYPWASNPPVWPLSFRVKEQA